ncbi:MAG TPA: hypothetical protein VGA10_05140 [Thermoanaerobaculia bacterium]
MPTKHVLLCLLISAGCTRALQLPKPTPPAPETRGATIVDLSRAKLASDDLNPSEVPAVVEATFRLMPDRRVLTAVTDIYELSTGRQESKVEIDFRDNAWQIRCAGENVGSLPELATFQTNLDFLTQWAARLRSQRQIAPPLSPGALAMIDHDIAAFTPPSLFAATDVIARNSKNKSLDGVAAARAAHAAALLTSQIYDLFELGDPLRARSLALLAIARQGDQNCCAQDVALLASLLDYATESNALAASLPPSASAAQSQWEKERATLRRDEAADLDVQYAPLLNEVTTFGGQIPAARTVESLILRETESNKYNAGSIAFDGDSAAYANLNFDEKDPLQRFEVALPKRVETLQNSILDSDAVRSYYESNFYAAVYKEFAFHHYSRGDRAGETAFESDLGKPATDVPRQILAWMSAMTIVHYDAARGARGPRELLASVPLVGGIRSTDLLTDDARAIGGNEIAVRRAAVELYPRLDARPSEMYEAGEISLQIVADPSRRDRYMSTGIERLPSFPARGNIAYFRFLTRDRAALRALVDSGPNASERLQALGYLTQLGDEDSAFVHRKFEELAGDSTEMTALSAYTNYLNQHGEPAVKERFMRRWLQKHHDEDSILVAWATASLANALDRQGKYREAWDVLEPQLWVGQSNGMIHGASILQHLGRIDEANKLAAAAVERYPGADTRTVFATILWREGRLDEAAALFDPKKAVYSVQDARWSMPEQFFETFKDAKIEKSVDAYNALIAVRLNEQLLIDIPQKALAGHHADMAFALVDRLMAEASFSVGAHQPYSIPPLAIGYHALKQLKGDDAALAWLQAGIPPPAIIQALVVFYEDGEFDLVQRFAASASIKLPEAAALEAASLLRLRVPQTDGRWLNLRERIAVLPGSANPMPMVQYLAGLADESTFMAAAKKRENRIDAEYFIGVKRLAEKNPDGALSMMIAASYGDPNYPPSAWGLGQLYRWIGENTSWQDTAANIARPETKTAAK